MARSFPQTIIDEVNSNRAYPVQFVTIDVDNDPDNSLYLNTSYRTLEYNGRDYVPGSNVVSISPVEETQDIKTNALNIQLSGVPNDIIAALEGVNTIGGIVTIHEGFLNQDNQLVSGTVYQKWSGIINSLSTDEENRERSGDINVTIECKSKVGALLSSKGGRNTSDASFVSYQLSGLEEWSTTGGPTGNGRWSVGDSVKYQGKVYTLLTQNSNPSHVPGVSPRWTDITDKSMEFVASMVDFNPFFGRED